MLGGVSGHGGDEYEQIVVDGELILQLHRADVADHDGYLADPSTAMGNGVALWFEVSDFEAAVARIRTCGATVQTEPHMNPNAGQHEIWLRDPDGYLVVLAGPSVGGLRHPGERRDLEDRLVKAENPPPVAAHRRLKRSGR